jgi:serine/threonine protein kinase
MNPGDTLSRYRIAALVGAGGMGEVYKAEDTRLKRPVALKVLTSELGDNPDGHVFPFSRMIKDSLDWLDKYLGAPRWRHFGSGRPKYST